MQERPGLFQIPLYSSLAPSGVLFEDRLTPYWTGAFTQRALLVALRDKIEEVGVGIRLD